MGENKCGFDSLAYFNTREKGRQSSLGWKNSLYGSLYKNFDKSKQTLPPPVEGKDWGSVFGFGFAPDGSVLAAACEKKCFLLYDPTSFKLISRKYDVHTDCVNCVKFLDNRLFATCSDDNTVKIWDMRSLKQDVKTLVGHSSWVKNIEYVPSTGKLVTSGFDGNIFTWDINNYSDCSTAPEQVIHINGLMRTVLTPAADKMIISTQGGYFIMIHDLDLEHLKEDMGGFKPHLYRIMQVLKVPVNNAMEFNYMFSRERNRIEYFGDFPENHSAESISSIEVHPQGWCIASRNTTTDESEWTCVHDIQSTSHRKTKSKKQKQAGNRINTEQQSETCKSPQRGPPPRRETEDPPPQLRPFGARPFGASSSSRSPLLAPSLPLESRRLVWQLLDSSINNLPGNLPEQEDSSDDGDYDPVNDPFNELSEDSMSEPEEEELEEEEMGRLRDILGASRSERLSRPSLLDMPGLNAVGDATSEPSVVQDFQQWWNSHIELYPNADDDTRDVLFEEYLISRYRGTQLGGEAPVGQQIESMQPRLLFHIEEPNVGLGFIKEQSFSPDGRVLASPFGNCVRLLGFNKPCHELCDCVPPSVQPLAEIVVMGSMNSIVLSSTFSPTQPIIAAGCRDGTIAFCTPTL